MRHLVAATVTVIAITVMTIATELSKSFKSILVSTFTHHWIGKSIIALALFFALIFILKKDYNIRRWTKILAATTIICSTIIVLFYVWHFFSSL